MAEYKTIDLINLSLSEKPLDFETVLSSLLADKVEGLVETRWTEIAQDLFVDQEPEEEVGDDDPEVDAGIDYEEGTEADSEGETDGKVV